VEGHHWREDRVWEKCAVLVAHLGFHSKATSAREILDGWRRSGDEAEFERVAGISDPAAELDAMIAKQQARKARDGT